MALAVLGVVASVAGTFVQMSAAKAAADHNAKVAEINAKVARQQAGADAKEKRRERLRLMGQIRNQVAGNGLQTTGSVLDVTNDNFLTAFHDEKMTVYQGEVRATDFENKAAGEKLKKKAAGFEGGVGIVSDLVTGAGKVLDLA